MVFEDLLGLRELPDADPAPHRVCGGRRLREPRDAMRQHEGWALLPEPARAGWRPPGVEKH